MLNTSLHNPNVRDRPPFERFVSMNRGINDGGDLPEEQLRVREPTAQATWSPGVWSPGPSLGGQPTRGASEMEHSKRGLGEGPPTLVTVLRRVVSIWAPIIRTFQKGRLPQLGCFAWKSRFLDSLHVRAENPQTLLKAFPPSERGKLSLPQGSSQAKWNAGLLSLPQTAPTPATVRQVPCLARGT